jgi:lysyl-tRNA synthetase class 2
MDEWRAQPSWQTLVARDRLNQAIRAFFRGRDLVEISTPVLGLRGSPDCHLQSLEVHSQQDKYFLQTSPEFAMKRVLATYGQAIYQICPAFRQADMGRLHNPEFSILEWYQPGFELGQLMDEVMALLRSLPDGKACWAVEPNRISYREAFLLEFGVDPNVASLTQLNSLIEQHTRLEVSHLGHYDDEMERSDCLDYLFSECIAVGFSGLTWVVDFPVCQAAMAEVDAAGQTARRFELYAHGIELANGYQELTDATEMESRFNQWNQYRANRGLPHMAVDQRLISAISELPRTSGVAMGLDRLLMVSLGQENIAEVMPFVWPVS